MRAEMGAEGRADPAVETGDARPALAAESRPARGDEIYPALAIDAVVLLPRDVALEAVARRELDEALSNPGLLARQHAKPKRQVACAITDVNGPVAQRPDGPADQAVRHVPGQRLHPLDAWESLVVQLAGGRLGRDREQHVEPDVPRRRGRLVDPPVVVLDELDFEALEPPQLVAEVRRDIMRVAQDHRVMDDHNVELVEVEGKTAAHRLGVEGPDLVARETAAPLY